MRRRPGCSSLQSIVFIAYQHYYLQSFKSMYPQSNLARREGPHSQSGKASPRNLQSALFGRQEKAARSSYDLDKSLLSWLQSSKVDHEGLPFWKVPRNHSDAKQHLHFLKNQARSQEFLAYVIVSKQSNFGVSSHERLVLIDSFSKQIKYYSKIPSFPLVLSQLPPQPKETLSMSLAKKFSIAVSKTTIGEVDIKWIQSGEEKKWIFRLASNNLARQFATLAERVRLNQYINQQININQKQGSPKATNFIEDISKLEQQKPSSHSINGESAQIGHTLSIPAAIKEAISQQSPIKQEGSERSEKEERNISLIGSPEVVPTSSKEDDNRPNAGPLNQVNPTDSIKSIKMEAILKELYQKADQQIQIQKTQAIQQLPKQSAVANKQLQQSKVSNKSFNQSQSKRHRIFQAPLSPKPRQAESPLGLSKILVTKLDSPSLRLAKKTDKMPAFKQQAYQTPSRHLYNTQKPQILNRLRENLLEQRRFTQPTEGSQNQSRRSSYIVNLHSQPQREKSSSKSRQKSVSQFQAAQREWLLKWVSISSLEDRAELYSQFVESCKLRVRKLTESFLNWHLFHKEVSEYIIKQNNVEYRYFMLGKEGTVAVDVLAQEEEMLNRMEDLKELWAMLSSFPQNTQRVVIPLACIVIYKGLKVFCKAELFSNSLIISELKERHSFRAEIQAIKAHFKGCLSYANFFLLSSNTNKWLYISQIETSSNLSSRGTHSLSYAFIHNYFRSNNSFSIQKAQEYLREQSIIAYLQELNASTLLSSFDFSRILKKHLLNPTLLPLIYQIGEERAFLKARKWVISEMCSIFLQKQARSLIHGFLLKKKINKNIDEEIYLIISKLLRWENEGSSIIAEASRFLGVALNFKLADIIVDQYVISSLLNRLRINCRILLPESIIRVDQRDPHFWRSIEFEEDFTEISFGMAAEGLDHSFFSQDFRKIDAYLSFQEIMISSAEQVHFCSLFSEKRGQLKKSILCKLLPWEKQAKVEQYEAIFRGETSSSTSQYYGLEELRLNVAHLLKLKKDYHGKVHYQKWENAILLEMIRANLWARQASKEIIQMHLLLSEQYYSCMEESKCIEESLSLLKLSLAFKQQGLIGIEQLLQITVATANTHMAFKRLDSAFNFFKLSQTVLDEILRNTRKVEASLFPFFECYKKCADILLERGRYEQCLGQIAYVRKLCDSWKQSIAFKLKEYEPIKQVIFHLCSLVFRTYEILSKRIELLQLVEDNSRQFIQNYFMIQGENNLVFDDSYIQVEVAAEVIKQIWKAVMLNLAPKNVSYQYYFSKTYSLLKAINTSVILGITKAIEAESHQSTPCSQEEALSFLCTLIYSKCPKSALQRLSSKSAQSILVQQCIVCLAHLSSEGFLDPQNEQEESKNKQELKFLSVLLSLMGFSFAVSCLEHQLQEEQH